MSIEIMTRVWKQSKQTECSRLLLLLALADHADPEGICFPGVPHLARKIRKTKRHVRRLLRDLEGDGEIYTSTNRGPHLANLYLVTVGFTQDEIEATLIERLKVPKKDANGLAAMLLTPDAHVTPTPDAEVRSPLTPASTTPDVDVSLTVINHHEPSDEPSLSADADPDLPIVTDKSPGYTPGPGKIVSCVDPDTDEEVGEPDWRTPRGQIACQAFEAAGRTRLRYTSKAEYNKILRIERMIKDGSRPLAFWENRIWCAANYKWPFPKLLKNTLSEDSFREWERKQA